MAATSQVRASPDDRLGYNGTRPLMVLLSGTMLSQGHHLFGPLPPIREELPGLNIIFHHENIWVCYNCGASFRLPLSPTSSTIAGVAHLW